MGVELSTYRMEESNIRPVNMITGKYLMGRWGTQRQMAAE